MIDQTQLSERPRERCLAFGAESLSLRECFAIILGSGPRGKGCLGLARDLLRLDQTDDAHAEERFLLQWLMVGPALLESIKGIGPGQKAKLLASFEIARRLMNVAQKQKKPKTTLHLRPIENKAVRRIPMHERTARGEWFGFVGVFKSGQMTDLRIVARAQGPCVSVDKQKLFLEILLTGAPGFILIHNHPSGDLTVSHDDRALTSAVELTARALNLQLVSHLIVSTTDATSFCNDQ